MDSRRVLIVEDETLTAMAIERCLTELGCEVVGLAATGEEALRKARAEAPDLIFMDVHLAGAMDGFEAARRINAERRTPTVIISGYSDRVVEAGSAQFEAAAYLPKPIGFDEIAELLRAIPGG